MNYRKKLMKSTFACHFWHHSIRPSTPLAFKVSVLEAFKQLHDSKKRGTQSLADVPVEHLAKAGWLNAFFCLGKCGGFCHFGWPNAYQVPWARDGKGEETVLSDLENFIGSVVRSHRRYGRRSTMTGLLIRMTGREVRETEVGVGARLSTTLTLVHGCFWMQYSKPSLIDPLHRKESPFERHLILNCMRFAMALAKYISLYFHYISYLFASKRYHRRLYWPPHSERDREIEGDTPEFVELSKMFFHSRSITKSTPYNRVT